MKAYITATTDPCEIDEITGYIKQLQEVGVDYVHFDVMDGIFVERKRLNPEIIKAEIKKNNTFQAAIHLMVSEPLESIESYIQTGAKFIIVHYEAFKDKTSLISCLKKINKSGAISGVALNPETPLSVMNNEILEETGLIMIMGVVPGKSGQKMLDGIIEKVRDAVKLSPDKFVACDGGINEHNFEEVISAGADFISTGSFMHKLIKEGTAKQFMKKYI